MDVKDIFEMEIMANNPLKLGRDVYAAKTYRRSIICGLLVPSIIQTGDTIYNSAPYT